MSAKPFLILLLAASPFGLGSVSAEDDYLKDMSAKAEALHAEWLKPGGHDNKDLTGQLMEADIKAERPEFAEEIVAGGDLALKEIPLPAEAKSIGVTVLCNLGATLPTPYSGHYPWVIRRMTADRFEVWLPNHGWLFNDKGALLHEAHPHRHDGDGRQWYGAFLPDGRWVTTDLWEMDRTLHFYSAKGRWLFDRSSIALAPRHPDDDPYENNAPDLLGWCRCDRSGKGFIVSIGANGGRAIVYVDAAGKSRRLADQESIYDLAYPRDLEPKGMYTSLDIPSDDGKDRISFSVPGHGVWCGTPSYQWGATDGVFIPNGDHIFGFLPGSHEVYLGASDYPEESANAEEPPPQRELKTWFFDTKGACRGWLRGSYLANDGRITWYSDEKGGVTVLDPDLHPVERREFNADGTPITPEKLFPDLHLGLFHQGTELILASW